MSKKIIISLIIVLVVLAAGVFCYYKYFLPAQSLQSSEGQTFQNQNIYQFNGQITKIDLVNKTISIKVEQVLSLTGDLSVNYQNKTYNFITDENTEFSQMNINASGSVISKSAAIGDFKINDRALLVVPTKEINNNNNFLISSATKVNF